MYIFRPQHQITLHYHSCFWKYGNKGTCPSSNESRGPMGSVFFLASFLMKIFTILTNAPPAQAVCPTVSSMGEEMVRHYYNWSEGDRGQIGDILIPLSRAWCRLCLSTFTEMLLLVELSQARLVWRSENGKINEIRHKEREEECVAWIVGWGRDGQWRRCWSCPRILSLATCSVNISA